MQFILWYNKYRLRKRKSFRCILESVFKFYLLAGYDAIFNYIVILENLENIKNEFKNYIIKFVVKK